MDKENKTLSSLGLKVSKPRLVNNKTCAVFEVLLSCVLVTCGVFGTLWCLISAFSLPVYTNKVNLFTFVFILIFLMIYYVNSLQNTILILTAVLYSAALFFYRSALVQGFIIATNRIMTTYSQKSDFDFPSYIISAEPEQFQNFCTLFILFASFIFTLFVSFAVIRKKSFWLTFLITFPFLLSTLIFTITPNFFSFLLILLCWTILILIRIPSRKIKNGIKNRHKYCINDSSVKIGIFSIPILILCFAIITAAFPRKSYQRPEETEKFRESINNVFTETAIFGGSALSGNYKDVDLKSKGNIKFTGKTMLKIKTDKKYPLYLKSFAGGIYDGYSWKELPDSSYKDINQKLDGMNIQNMFHAYLTLLGQQNNTKFKPFSIRVKNVGAVKQCIYAPYNLRTIPENITGVKFINDAFIRSSSIFGTNEYSLYAYGLHKGQIQTDISGLLLNISKGSFRYSQSWNSYLSNLYKFSGFNDSSDIKAYYKSTLQNDLLNFFDYHQKNFVLADQNYRMFMYDKYTQLPKEIKEKVNKMLEQEGISTGNSSINNILKKVKSYLNDNCRYTLSPGKIPNGRDFTDYFLFENHKGYCVHFATAAAVMLRSMGIPARYAEGYVINEDDYAKVATDGWTSICDNRAHAWTEVYYPGIGWQPVEMTPGISVEYNFMNNNFENEPSVSSETIIEEKQENKVERTKKTEHSEGNLNQKIELEKPNFSVNLSVLMLWVFLTLIAVLILNRRIILIKRKKLFLQEDTNKAALYIYAYLEKITKFGGEISKKVNEIALKARFSQHSITKEELSIMTNFAYQISNENYKQISRIKKFVFKYVKNLI